MSAATAVEPRNDIERLLQDLADSENVGFAVSPGDWMFIAGLRGSARETTRCSCHQDLWSLETSAWVLHLRPASVQRVRFVREPDPHAPACESLGIHFVGANDQSLVRAHIRPLYDEQSRPLAAPFAFWEALRAKYGGLA
jgi:hypothetical protein